MYDIHPSRLCMPHCTGLCPLANLTIGLHYQSPQNHLILAINNANSGSRLEVGQVEELYLRLYMYIYIQGLIQGF